MFKQYGIINSKVIKVKKNTQRDAIYYKIIELKLWFEQGIIINLDKKDNNLLQCLIL